MTVKRRFVNNNLNIGKFLAVQKLGETIAHFLVISNTPSLTSVVCPSYSFVTIHYRILQQNEEKENIICLFYHDYTRWYIVRIRLSRKSGAHYESDCHNNVEHSTNGTISTQYKMDGITNKVRTGQY